MAQTIGNITYDTTRKIGQEGFWNIYAGSYNTMKYSTKLHRGYKQKKAEVIKIPQTEIHGSFQDNWATIKALSSHEQIVKYYGYERDENWM